MVGLLLFQILLLGITGSLGQDCDCELCKYVPDGQYKGYWENPVQGSFSCPNLNKDPVTFGCLYTKYNTTETMCFCNPGNTAYDVCFDEAADVVTPPGGVGKCDMVRERKNVSITCSGIGGDSTINITYAYYGILGGCHSAHALNIVQGICQGHNSCTVPATNNVFGDPCPGIPKILQVCYYCDTPP